MTITRAVLYARVSTDRQAAEGVSLDNQLELARAHADKKGWVFVGQYVDVMSGKNDKRVELARLMADAERRAFDVVIVYKLDRLARSTRKIYEVLGEFEDRDIEFISLTQDIDSSKTGGKAMTGMYAIFAEMESDHISERVKSAMRYLVTTGKNPGGVVPLGYRLVDGAYVIHEPEAEIVRLVFETYIRIGMYKRTAMTLNENGIRTQTGQPFSTNAVKKIVGSLTYLGHSTWGKVEIVKSRKGRRTKPIAPENWIVRENTHAPIVDLETWETAASITKAKAGKHPRVIFGETRSAWSGLLKCSCCGSMLVHSVKRRPGIVDYSSYRCNKYVQQGLYGCSKPGIAQSQFVKKKVVPALSSAIQELYEQSATASKPRTKKQPNKAKMITELESRRQREMDLYREGMTAFDEMKRKVMAIDEKLVSLSSEDAPRTAVLPTIPGTFSEIWEDSTEAERGEYLRAFIDHAEVSQTEMTVYFNEPEWAPDGSGKLIIPR